MNLREVREAAELYKTGEGKSHERFMAFEMMSNYILATIDPEPDLPITAEWLREEYPQTELLSYYEDTPTECHCIGIVDTDICLNFEPLDNRVYLYDAGNERVVIELPIITTRQQFCDLARCLGIPRRKDGK